LRAAGAESEKEESKREMKNVTLSKGEEKGGGGAATSQSLACKSAKLEMLNPRWRGDDLISAHFWREKLTLREKI